MHAPAYARESPKTPDSPGLQASGGSKREAVARAILLDNHGGYDFGNVFVRFRRQGSQAVDIPEIAIVDWIVDTAQGSADAPFSGIVGRHGQGDVAELCVQGF